MQTQSSARWEEMLANPHYRAWLARSATHCPQCQTTQIGVQRCGADWLVRCERRLKLAREKEPHYRPCGWQLLLREKNLDV